MQLIDRVRAFGKLHTLWGPETRVVAALSGGSDSVALLRLLHDLHLGGELVLDCAAHLHHGSRGDDADTDQVFCAALAERLSTPFITTRVEVPSLAARDRVSFEVAARRARHRFLDETRAARGSDLVVATAHTRNDQAETVLLRAVRGAGGRGLGGIAPRRGHLIRPVLDCTRDELRADLARRAQDWREDATNADLRNPRNRLRHEVIPYLRAHFNPSVVDALARLADVAREDEAWIESLADTAAAGVTTAVNGEVRVNGARLAEMPHALARRVARRALEAARPGRTFDLQEVDSLLAVAAGDETAAEISGLRVERFRDSAVLIKRATPARPRRRGASAPW